MFREMRRKKQALDEKACKEILERGTAGVFALCGEDYPYAYPMSYIYQDGKIYFHSARDGHKIDSLKKNSKVSFCVIDKDEIVPEEFTTYYRSVIIFGRARFIEEEDEIWRTIRLLSDRFSPNQDLRRDEEVKKDFNQLQMVEVTIDHMSGKEAIELVKMRG